MKISTADLNRSMSNVPSARTNLIRFSEARLHALLSRNMYSLHGLLELIGAVALQVCQRWIVSSYCIPGSPQVQVPSAIPRINSRALYVGPGLLGFVTQCVVQSLSSSTARMKSSVTRTLRFSFWKETEPYASPLKSPEYPCSMRAHALRSS